MHYDNKTNADIVRDIRNGEFARCLASITDTGAMHDMLCAIADRIEAAERERAIADALLAVKDKPIPHPDPDNAPPMYPGDAAAMRNALTGHDMASARGAINDLISDCNAALSGATCEAKNIHIRAAKSAAKGAWSKLDNLIRAALSAPARNCDRFEPAEEAYNAWDASRRATCGHNSCLSCCEFSDSAECAIAWLFAPAEGGARCVNGLRGDPDCRGCEEHCEDVRKRNCINWSGDHCAKTKGIFCPVSCDEFRAYKPAGGGAE